MTQKHRNNERGFTLIELMVILLVVGILASIAIPLYIRSRPKPTGADVTSGIRTLNYPFNAGDDQLALPSPALGATEAPSVPQATVSRSTDAPPAATASVRPPASAAPLSPTPAGVEPPHVGPLDNG